VISGAAELMMNLEFKISRSSASESIASVSQFSHFNRNEEICKEFLAEENI
jgi:hypothetical protein